MSLKRYYGFVDGGDGHEVTEIVLNIRAKYGIKRGYDSDVGRTPFVTNVYYYVKVKKTKVEVVDSDTELHVRYEKVSPKLKKYLEKIQKKCRSLGHEVSDLGMMYNVGTKEPMDTKDECVEVKYETDGWSSGEDLDVVDAADLDVDDDDRQPQPPQ